MEINKSNFFKVQKKINCGEKPEGLFKRLAYNFSKYNSMFLPQKINELSRKLIQEDIEQSEIRDYFAIPKEYEKLFKLYLNN